MTIYQPISLPNYQNLSDSAKDVLQNALSYYNNDAMAFNEIKENIDKFNEETNNIILNNRQNHKQLAEQRQKALKQINCWFITRYDNTAYIRTRQLNSAKVSIDENYNVSGQISSQLTGWISGGTSGQVSGQVSSIISGDINVDLMQQFLCVKCGNTTCKKQLDKDIYICNNCNSKYHSCTGCSGLGFLVLELQTDEPQYQYNNNNGNVKPSISGDMYGALYQQRIHRVADIYNRRMTYTQEQLKQYETWHNSMLVSPINHMDNYDVPFSSIVLNTYPDETVMTKFQVTSGKFNKISKNPISGQLLFNNVVYKGIYQYGNKKHIPNKLITTTNSTPVSGIYIKNPGAIGNFVAYIPLQVQPYIQPTISGLSPAEATSSIISSMTLDIISSIVSGIPVNDIISNMITNTTSGIIINIASSVIDVTSSVMTDITSGITPDVITNILQNVMSSIVSSKIQYDRISKYQELHGNIIPNTYKNINSGILTLDNTSGIYYTYDTIDNKKNTGYFCISGSTKITSGYAPPLKELRGSQIYDGTKFSYVIDYPSTVVDYDNFASLLNVSNNSRISKIKLKNITPKDSNNKLLTEFCKHYNSIIDQRNKIFQNKELNLIRKEEYKKYANQMISGVSKQIQKYNEELSSHIHSKYVSEIGMNQYLWYPQEFIINDKQIYAIPIITNHQIYRQSYPVPYPNSDGYGQTFYDTFAFSFYNE